MSRIPDVQFRKRSHRDINKNSRTLETNKKKASQDFDREGFDGERYWKILTIT